MSKRRKVSTEYKRKAVAVRQSLDVSVSQVAAELAFFAKASKSGIG